MGRKYYKGQSLGAPAIFVDSSIGGITGGVLICRYPTDALCDEALLEIQCQEDFGMSVDEYTKMNQGMGVA